MSDSKKFRKFKKVPLLVSILLLAASCLAFWWVYREIRQNEASAEAARTAWLLEESRRYEIQSLDILLRDTEEERKTIDTHFAQSSNIVLFLDSIEELARSVDARPDIVSVDAPKDGAGLLVAVRAEGSFESIYKFLELLENSPYELEFLAFDIGKRAEESPSWEAMFNIRLLSFLPS